MITAHRTSSSWLQQNALRLDASYYCGPGQREARQLVASNVPKIKLSDLTQDGKAGIYIPSRFKRVFVEKGTAGCPYLTGSGIMQHDPLSNCRKISKKYTKNIDDLLLNPNCIVITCSGNIGNTIYVSDYFKDAVGTPDLIRIIPNQKIIPAGYLYAFLSSKIGKALIIQNTYGSVVEHIESHHLFNMPVPLLDDDLMEDIHRQIDRAVSLRKEANALRAIYQKRIESKVGLKIEKQNDHKVSFKINSKLINDTTINAWNYSPFYEQIFTTIKEQKYNLLSNLTKPNGIFLGKLFKRIPASKEKGYELISQRDLMRIRSDGRFISAKSVQNVNDYMVGRGTILIAAVGATDPTYAFGIGHYVFKNFEGKFINPDTLRIIPEPKKILPAYLFGFLDSIIGKMMFHSTIYGTKLIRFIPKLLGKIPISLPDKQFQHEISEHVEQRYNKYSEALDIENIAINQLERDLEKWLD